MKNGAALWLACVLALEVAVDLRATDVPAAEQQPGAAEFKARRQKWDRLLVGSALAQGGDWPWQELLGSADSGDSLLATLAAGTPGAPGRIGVDVAAKAWRAARPDGVLVRPDSPIAPVRESAVGVLTGSPVPMVAWAYTEHAGQRTAYVFAYDRSGEAGAQATFSPAELGFSGQVMVLNRVTGEAWRQPSDEPYLAVLESNDYAYYEVAPVRPNGVVFFGDQGKFVSDGKQRIAAVENVTGGVSVTVDFAVGETVVAVFGYSRSAPVVRARQGSAKMVNFIGGNGRYTVQAYPAAGGAAVRRAKFEILIPAPVFTEPNKD